MVDAKWMGTEADRREMRTLNLKQVVRVSALHHILYRSSPALLTAAAAQFRYTCNVWLLLNLALHLGSHCSVCRVPSGIQNAKSLLLQRARQRLIQRGYCRPLLELCYRCR